MKKLIFVCVAIMLSFAILTIEKLNVYASDTYTYIDTFIPTENIGSENKETVLKFYGLTTKYAMIVDSTISIQNTTINIENSNNLKDVIVIDSNGELTLDNVTINVSSVSECVIYNAGKLTLNNCNIVCNKVPVEIINSSDIANAILLKNVRENDISSIQLQSGSVFVDSTTKIDGKITLSLSDPLDQDSDSFIGRALVKGIGYYASKFLDNFAFSGLDDGANYNDIVNKYYLDYVGNIGDDIDVYDDGYLVSDGDTNVDIIDSGDIILTKFNVSVNLSSTSAQSLDEDFADISVNSDGNTKVYIGGKYATSQRFLKYINSTSHQNFLVSGKVLDLNDSENIISKTFALDNCTSLIGHSRTKAMTFRGSVDSGRVNINYFVDGVLDESQNKTELMPAQIEDGDVYTSSKIISLDLANVTLDKIESENVTIQYLEDSKTLLYLKAPLDFVSGKIDVYTKTIKLEPVQKEIYISSATYQYSATNILDTINPYYLDGEDQVFLNTDEYKFHVLDNNDYIETNTIKDVGKYKIVATSQNEDIVFTNVIEFEIYPKELTLSFDKDCEYSTGKNAHVFSYVYDGEPKDFGLQVLGVLDGDSVDVVKCDENSSTYSTHTRPGTYNGVFKLLNTNNYVLANDFQKFVISIDRAHIDESLIEAETYLKEVEYTGNAYTIGLKNDVDGVIVNAYSYTDVGTYIFNIYLSVDTSLYYPLSSNKNIINNVKLVITPKVIFVNDDVVFPNLLVDYRNEIIHYEIPQSTLDALNYEIDRKITITEPEIVNASKTPYPVEIDIQLKSEFQKNYVLNKTHFETSITVNKIDIDMSKIIYNDQTVVFNGEKQIILAVNNLAGIVAIKYREGSMPVGDHEQQITIELLDDVNYNELKINTKSATITILPLVVDMSNVKFESATFEYDENKKQKLTVENWIYEKIEIHYSYYLNNKLVEDTKDGVSKPGNYTVIASFEPVLEFNGNVSPIADLQATLQIKRPQIDFAKIKFTDETYEYDGKEHSNTSLICPYDISFTYSITSQTNAGEYIVEAIPDIDLEIFECVNYRKITAKLIITKKKVDMSNVTFANETKKYNGRNIEVTIKGKLPNEVASVTYLNNIQKDVGIYDAIASFELKDKLNYEEIPDKTCIITITPITLTISMPVEKFKYTGSPINVELSVNGVLPGDDVIVSLKNNGNINVGKYYSQIEISNSNYVCSKTQVNYTIEKAEVDLSNISFEDVEVVYDGKEHVPQLIGTLPNSVTANIVVNKAKNVGEYVAYVDFTVTNPNYLKPDRISAKVTITPRPTLVEFSNYYRLIEDGQTKEIGISFSDVIEADFDDYIVTYSSEPIFAGSYTVSVTLPSNSNYELLGVKSLNFEILSKSKTYVNSGYEIKLESDGFKKDASIELGSVENLAEKLEDLNVSIANYNAFSLNMNNVENRKEVNVSLKTNSLNISNSKMLRVYRIVGNEIEKVDFECVGDQIKFVANIGDGIIIIEEKTQITKSMVLIVTLIASSIAIVVGIVIGFYISKKRKKTVNHFLHNDN